MRPESRFRFVPWLLTGAAIAFGVLAHLSELTVDAPQGNDRVLHLGAISRVNDAWQAGDNPRDPWIPYWSQGFPLLRYYQHLSHLTVASVFRLLRGSVPLEDVFTVVQFLLLVLAPASFYAGARLLGFAPLAAGLVAACVPALAVAPDERFLTGFQASSYLWAGPGLFPQLAGMVLFAPAVGAVHRALVGGRHFGVAFALLAALCLTHMLLGYMACALSALALLRPELAGRRLRAGIALAAVVAATLLAASYVVVPALREFHFLHRSVWESPEYWHSYGMRQVLDWLARGALLDGPRIPVLTLLAGAGLVVAVVGSARAPVSPGAHRFAVAAFLSSLALYFGRPTWGALLDVLPFADVLPMHRWICAVQYAGVLLAGLALAWVWQAVQWRRSAPRLALAIGATAIALGPAYGSQWQASRLAATAQRSSEQGYRSDGRVLAELLRDIHRRDLEEPGRAYAGTVRGWGRSFSIGFVPIYMFWQEYDVSAIAYPFMMSLNTDVEGAFDPRRKDHYDLFNVRYLLHRDRAALPSFAQVVARRPALHAATVDTPGYFSVVGADLFYRFGAGRERDLLEINRAFVRSSLHAGRRFVRIGVGERARPRDGEREIADAAELRARSGDAWRPPDGAVSEVWGHDDRFGATVESRDPAYVLFRMTFHPGWRARVDDEPVETVMLSPSYVGVPIDPGRHRIELAYAPGAWTSVLFYAGMALVALALLADRLDVWTRIPREWKAYRRPLAEAALAVAVLAALRAVAGAPIPDARMPHSEAAHARKLAWDEDRSGGPSGRSEPAQPHPPPWRRPGP